MRVSIGGVSFNLGGEVENRVHAAALHAVVATAREWLRVAVYVLGPDHAAIVTMQKLVADYDARQKTEVQAIR
jgi:hypothetical protein